MCPDSVAVDDRVSSTSPCHEMKGEHSTNDVMDTESGFISSKPSNNNIKCCPDILTNNLKYSYADNTNFVSFSYPQTLHLIQSKNGTDSVYIYQRKHDPPEIYKLNSSFLL